MPRTPLAARWNLRMTSQNDVLKSILEYTELQRKPSKLKYSLPLRAVAGSYADAET